MPPPQREQPPPCAYCGEKNASFGFDGFDGFDHKGRFRWIEPLWSCNAHRAEVREMGEIRKAQRIQARIEDQVAAARAQKAGAAPATARHRGPDQRQTRLFG